MCASCAPEAPRGGAGAPDLAAVCAAALERPVPAFARELSEAVRARHDGVSAMLLYGSCLRRDTPEGVVDLLVIVDRYRDAYGRGPRGAVLAAANALLPPNVFYLELPPERGGLRLKYSVVSARDFGRGAAFRSVQAFVWARACQPMCLLYARDDAARERVRRGAGLAALALVERTAARLPVRGGRTRIAPAELFEEAFRQTYRAEWRVEQPETIRGVYTADREHYDRLLPAALRRLEELGRLRVHGGAPGGGAADGAGAAIAAGAAGAADGGALDVAIPARRRVALRASWAVRRPLAKSAAALRLLKSAATFADWVPYVLWKLERHRGVRIETTPRQRRRAFVWGWPVLFRVLRRRHLR